MKLEAVTVSVEYSDLLAASLGQNLLAGRFDRMVVVTTPEDQATQRVCDAYDVEVVLTDAFESRWGKMRKARGVDAGLQHLELDGWVLHLDADIVLPPRTRTLLEHSELNADTLYGTDRLKVPDYESWQAHQALPTIQHDGYHVRLDAFPIMPRFNAWHLNGYAPPGFFQLWNPGASGVTRYPGDHSAADRSDMVFAGSWPRAKRALVPELAVYHLESEPAAQGTNWGGRQTKRFGPQPSHPDPEFHHHYQRREHRHHRHHWHRPPWPGPPCPPDPWPYDLEGKAQGPDAESE